MKLKYIIGAFAAALLFAGCQREGMVGSFSDFQLDKTFVSIDMDGGSQTVTITSAEDWEFTKHYDTGKKDDNNKKIYDYMPTWVSVDKLTGSNGASITITATKTESGRETELQLKSGDKLQHIIVRQGSLEAVKASCKEVIDGPDGKSFLVTGKVTSIANTTYGNWYLNDGTGEVYVYGTLDKDGKEKNFTSLGIEVGDVVTVKGPKTTYGTTIELVNVTVVKIEKALLSILTESTPVQKVGGNMEVKVASKGKGAYFSIPEGCASWISYVSSEFISGIPTIFDKNPADTTVFVFKVAENPADDARTGEIVFTSSKLDDDNKTISTEMSYTFTQKGGVQAVTVADFLAKAVGEDEYRLSGVITSNYASDTKGQSFYLKDATGEVLVYRLDDYKASGAKVGDIITVVGQRGDYKGTAQMVKGKYEKHTSVITDKTIAQIREAADDDTVLYMVTGEVVEATEPGSKNDLVTYGNFNIKDESGSIYVYGVSTGVGGVTKKFGTLGVALGDKITIIGSKTTYTAKNLVQIKNALYVSHTPANAQ